MPFEPIRIYFSDLRSSAGVREAVARVFTDWTTGVIQAVHRLQLYSHKFQVRQSTRDYTQVVPHDPAITPHDQA